MSVRLVNYLIRLHNKTGRWYRKWPHWSRDLTSLISYINFLGLIPTILSLALVPRHFFRRLPLVLQQKKPQFRTPVAFFVNGSVLFYLAFSLRHKEFAGYAEGLELVAQMLVLIPITPIAMALLALVLWCIYQLPRLIPTQTAFPQPNPYPLFSALSFQVYRNLDWPRYFWGLFYISVYFVSSWQFAMLAAGYGYRLNNFLLDTFSTSRGIVEVIITIVSLVCVGGIAHLLVFRPYGEMLRASLKQPVKNTIAADVFDLKEVVDDFLQKSQQQEIAADDIRYFCMGLEIPLKEYCNALRTQNFDYAPLAKEFMEYRSRMFSDAIKQAELREIVNAVDLEKGDAADLWHRVEDDMSHVKALLTAAPRSRKQK